MAVIPEFQRKQLASSVVGTPGVDTSQAQIGQAIAEFGGQAVDVISNQMEKRKRAADMATGTKAAIDFELAADEQLAAHKKKYIDDYEGKTKELETSLFDAFKQQEATISSPEARSMFTQSAMNTIRSRTLQERSWAVDRQVTKASEQIVGGVNSLAMSAYNKARSGDLNAALLTMHSPELQNLYRSADVTYSPEQSAKLRADTPKAIVTGITEGLLEGDPEIVLKVAESGQLNAYLKPEDISKLKTQAVQRLETMTANRNYETLLKHADDNPELFKKVISGTTSMLEIDTAMDSAPKEQQPFYQAMKAVFLKTKNAATIDDPEAEREIWLQLDRLGASAATAKKPAKIKLDELIGLQTMIGQKLSDNLITKDTANSFMNKILPSYGKAIKEGKASDTSVHAAFKQLKGYIRRDKELKDKPELQYELYHSVAAELYDLQHDKKQAQDPIALRQGLTKTAVQNVWSRYTQGRAGTAQSVNGVISKDGTKTFVTADKVQVRPADTIGRIQGRQMAKDKAGTWWYVKSENGKIVKDTVVPDDVVQSLEAENNARTK